MYPISIRYDKDLGSLAINARMLYGAGYWDFANGVESAEDTANCRVFLAELPTSSLTQSWYTVDVTLPAAPGPFPIEIFDGNGDLIGDDLAPGTAAGSTGGAGSTAAGITREQLAIKVLSVLGVYERSGLDAEDQQNVLDAYDAVYQELKDDGLVTWAQGDGEAIPVRFMNSIIAIVAATDVLLGSYPQDSLSTQRIMAGSVAAQRRIRRQLASAQDTETTTVEYF